MADDLRTIVSRMVAAGESEDNIAAVIKHYNTQQQASAPKAPAGPSHPLARLGYGIIDAVKNHPVQTLGTVGAMAAVPLTGGTSLLPSIAAAGLGGAGGAGLGTIVDAAQNRAPKDGVLKTMAKEGAIQGAVEGIGGGIVAPVMKRGARILMDNAVRPTQAVLREFPNVIDTLLKERLPVGRFVGRAGSQQAKSALQASAKTTRGLLQEADAAGVQIAPKDIMAELPTLRGEAVKSTGLPGGGGKGLADMEAEFAATHGTPKTPSEVKDLKRAAQSLSKPVFRAQNAGNMVGPDVSLGAQFNDAIAGGAKSSLESIPKFGPRIAESEARTQGLIGAKKALQAAEARRLPLWAELGSAAAGAATGGATGDPVSGLATAMALRAISSPRAVSRAAIGLDVAAPAASQGLRLAALLAALSGTSDQSTGPR